MSDSILAKDTSITPSSVTLLQASAGSGKTYALTLRYVQFLLSREISHNELNNILAITFSNNAARQMRERILEWLKDIHLGDDEKVVAITEILSLDVGVIRERAGLLVDELLDNYSDFQARTIDSFMASIFSTSAIDFGYSPATEIVLERDELLLYGYQLFLRNVRPGTNEQKIMDELIELASYTARSGSRYLWDPTVTVYSEIYSLYSQIASLPGGITSRDYTGEMAKVARAIIDKTNEINGIIERSGFETKNSSFLHVLGAVRRNAVADAIGQEFKRGPLKKASARTKEEKERFGLLEAEIDRLQSELKDLLASYATYYAYTYYHPYIQYIRKLEGILDRVKREQAQIFIEDIAKRLSTYLTRDIVPDIYLMLGDIIYHYLIDEFQDTSPIQWSNLRLLIENALAQGGSLFLVGDTKQAIYGFRGADYRIMKEMERTQVFPAARQEIKSLKQNYRSFERIIRFNEAFFDALLEDEEYAAAAKLSGLDVHTQEVRDGYEGKGYAEAVVFDRDDGNRPEREKLLEIVREAIDRGYHYRDIAIVALKNEQVATAGSWLSEVHIPFLSHSNLDARKRKVVGEIISFLRFLHSPVDNLSFASFCMGDIMKRALGNDEETLRAMHEMFTDYGQSKALRSAPLYKLFQSTLPGVWESRFEEIFSVTGYLPLYDLTCEMYKAFDLFGNFPDEEGALTKLLETVRAFESTGTNSIMDFLDYAADERTGDDWNIDTPAGLDAVTLMTIHKSKGLGFPVVIVLLYGSASRRRDYYLHESESGYHFLRLNQDIIASAPVLEPVYLAHRNADTADYLNSLYVALTRAEEELYVVGIRGSRNTKLLDYLPTETFAPTTKPAVETKRPETLSRTEAFHHTRRYRFDVVRPEDTALEEMARGELLHSVLAAIREVAYDDLEGTLRSAMEGIVPADMSSRQKEETLQVLSRFLLNDAVKPYYVAIPDRLIFNEKEVVDPQGRLFRIDRMVVDRDTATVIDFKTGGTAREADYIRQLRNYMGIANGIYPGRKVQSFICYLDRNIVRVIK
jgi:ATP-dependent helicase/nuclease subunit A